LTTYLFSNSDKECFIGQSYEKIYHINQINMIMILWQLTHIILNYWVETIFIINLYGETVS